MGAALTPACDSSLHRQQRVLLLLLVVVLLLLVLSQGCSQASLEPSKLAAPMGAALSCLQHKLLLPLVAPMGAALSCLQHGLRLLLLPLVASTMLR
eukprot:1154236-Pelagomonas_calceolata.AAC.3